jgi:hypothetical protein
MRRTLRLLAAALPEPLVYLAPSLTLSLIPGPGTEPSGPPTHVVALLHGTIRTDILFPSAPRFSGILPAKAGSPWPRLLPILP